MAPCASSRLSGRRAHEGRESTPFPDLRPEYRDPSKDRHRVHQNESSGIVPGAAKGCQRGRSMLTRTTRDNTRSPAKVEPKPDPLTLYRIEWDVDYWLLRIEEAYAVRHQMKSQAAKEVMDQVIASYRRLARMGQGKEPPERHQMPDWRASIIL